MAIFVDGPAKPITFEAFSEWLSAYAVASFLLDKPLNTVRITQSNDWSSWLSDARAATTHRGTADPTTHEEAKEVFSLCVILAAPDQFLRQKYNQDWTLNFNDDFVGDNTDAIVTFFAKQDGIIEDDENREHFDKLIDDTRNQIDDDARKIVARNQVAIERLAALLRFNGDLTETDIRRHF